MNDSRSMAEAEGRLAYQRHGESWTADEGAATGHNYAVDFGVVDAWQSGYDDERDRAAAAYYAEMTDDEAQAIYRSERHDRGPVVPGWADPIHDEQTAGE